MIRLYISEPTAAWTAGAVITLNPDQSRYLTSVMRLHVNDEVAIFNGRDGEWLSEISSIGKKAVILTMQRQMKPQPSANGPVLVIAMIKRSPLETIIEKATELGARSIQLVITRRSNVSHTNIERLELIAKEAAEQTERLDVPTIAAPVKLDAWLASNTCRWVVYGDENSTHDMQSEGRIPPALGALQDVAGKDNNANASVAIVIGPEGGFDDAERDGLRTLGGAVPVNLGPRILRADTAAISALTLVQAVLGDWR